MKKKNGWKSKGYTLIEVLVCMSISLSIILLIGKGVIEIENLTKMANEKVFNRNVAKGVEINIKKHLIEENNLYYGIEKNRLQIYRRLGNALSPVKDELYVVDEKLYLKYFREEEGNINGYETLLSHNIDEFNIVKKENSLYIVISIKGEKIYVCI
ncbi:MAG: prepilin-type N-terminal cleavage/methylation domain-containing protein [Clostridium sp.]|uniref:prepilin-type N-terminal cleavage/methylation domain-containing protein n=1 Tax=Clostridium sp. TaxID=1506 RepID=UPI003F405A46